MRTLTRKATVTVAATATVLATAGVGAAAFTLPADFPLTPAPTETAQTAKGNVASSGTFFFQYEAERAAGAAENEATGFFAGRATSPVGDVLNFAGPITCLYNLGNRTALFYPINNSQPELVAEFGAGVFIYVKHDGAGNATAFNFVAAPVSSTDGCYPIVPELFPATGTATATGG